MAWLKPHPIPTNPFGCDVHVTTTTLFLSHSVEFCQILYKKRFTGGYKFYKKW